MELPYPNDPASLSQPNPLFNDNAFVRGDQFRLNNSRAWSNFDFLEAYLNYTMTGLIKGRLYMLAASPTIIRIPVGNMYDVNSVLQYVSVEKTLDFSGLTNIYRTDGTTQITNVSETQEKHLYLLVNDSGTLQAMIVPDSDIVDHDYTTNPKFLEAYYTGTPSIWYQSLNGYYRNSKRIIACLRLDASNEIEFFYELDSGYRFQDVGCIAIGNYYTEARWKRAQPNCYLLDGSTITDMETEAPLLYALLGSNVLPNFNDRFLRNIDIEGARAMRDLQADALQGFGTNNILLNSSSGSIVINYASGGNPIYGNTSFGPVETSYGAVREADETRPKNFAASIQIVRG